MNLPLTFLTIVLLLQKFLLKAGNTASVLNKNKLATKHYTSILDKFPKSQEAFYIDIQIEKNSLK